MSTQLQVEWPAVSVEELHMRLGFSCPCERSEASSSKPLAQWKMETDDAPIFRYLYRNVRPRRHLEFGTWEGTGALYCLEECEATVWTINLLEGETAPDGNWAYWTAIPESENVPAWAQGRGTAYQTDARGFIGRRYLEKGLGHRVCQIYGDSRQWEISNYPEGFFDSALIDGGHSEDVVWNDTRKALHLVRSGGIVMWHDFCPDRDVYERCASTRGVRDAIRANWHWIGERVSDIFWIRPSWILLGVRK